ncbi:MAG: ABC transporter permease [Planctomycetota bacterium]|jgi:ABC-type lipoprotein release transport system permease subunit
MRGVPLRYSFRNLLRRPWRTTMTLFGLSLLVTLIIFLTAFGRSVSRALRLPGDPRNLIVLSKKAQNFEFSSIPRAELDLLVSDVADQLGTDEFGEPLFSREVYHFVNIRLAKDPAHEPRRSLLHGIDPDLAGQIVVGFELTGGRLPEPEANEVMVGRAVASRLRVPASMLAEGSTLFLRDVELTVVGTFEARGTLSENWILVPPDDLRNTLGRRDFSFARMQVKEGGDLEALATRLNLDERYSIRVLPEVAYFADFTSGFGHFQRFAVLLALVLGVGGILIGMNTMHNAVVGRIREIGTLRVLGFTKLRIFLAFLLESLLLCGLAGIAGAGFGLLTNGLPVRVPVAATFPVTVDGGALLVGIVSALLMGLLGILFPMVRALRTSPVEAVRAV